MREEHIHWWKIPSLSASDFNTQLHRAIDLMAEFMEVDPAVFMVVSTENDWSVIDQRGAIHIEKTVEPGGFLIALDDKLNWAFLTYDEFKIMFPKVNTDRELI